MVENQSSLQESYYWLNIRLPYHDWFRSLDQGEGLIFEMRIREEG